MTKVLLTSLKMAALALSLGSPALSAADSLPGQAASGFSGQRATLGTGGISSVLPVDQAFALTALIEAPSTLVLIWEIEDAYYLYRDSLDFRIAGSDETLNASIPAGERTEDEFFGVSEVYYQRLLVRIPFAASQLNSDNILEVEVSYQGCAAARYCYPMQHRAVALEVL